MQLLDIMQPLRCKYMEPFGFTNIFLGECSDDKRDGSYLRDRKEKRAGKFPARRSMGKAWLVFD